MRLAPQLIGLGLLTLASASGRAASDPGPARPSPSGFAATGSVQLATQVRSGGTLGDPTRDGGLGEPTARAASGVELRARLEGRLGSCGLEVPVLEQRRTALDPALAGDRATASRHAAAVGSLAERARSAALLPPGRLPDPRTLRGAQARELVAGLLLIAPERLGDTWIELAPRRSGRRLTFQILTDLADPAEHLESARLDLHGTFALSHGAADAYSVEAEGRLLEPVLARAAREHGVEALEHRLTLSLRGPAHGPATAYAR